MSGSSLATQAAALGLALACGGAALAAADTAAGPTLAQKQLVSGTDCQRASDPPLKRPVFLSSAAEYRDDVLITTRYCSATAHNQLTPARPDIVVVGPDPAASGEVKIFISTVPVKDGGKVHQACVRAGKAASAYARGPSMVPPGAPPAADTAIAGADVVTGTGKVNCEEFLRATAAENPLVVLAPAALRGSAISVHILSMIGSRTPPAQVQAAVDGLGQAASSFGLSSDEIRKNPQIVLGLPRANP
jgi:hypothetical protein